MVSREVIEKAVEKLKEQVSTTQITKCDVYLRYKNPDMVDKPYKTTLNVGNNMNANMHAVYSTIKAILNQDDVVKSKEPVARIDVVLTSDLDHGREVNQFKLMYNLEEDCVHLAETKTEIKRYVIHKELIK